MLRLSLAKAYPNEMLEFLWVLELTLHNVPTREGVCYVWPIGFECAWIDPLELADWQDLGHCLPIHVVGVNEEVVRGSCLRALSGLRYLPCQRAS